MRVIQMNMIKNGQGLLFELSDFVIKQKEDFTVPSENFIF